jgi:5-methylcytosine-specific restriction enzyme subunit McrC
MALIRRETLEESTGQTLELTEAQAAALEHAGRRLASSKLWWGSEEDADLDRSAISCRAVEPGRWNVTVANAVGVIGLDGLQLLVRPKIPTKHLLFLLARSGRFPRVGSERALAAAGDDLWPLVATWFVNATEDVLRRDLIFDYQDVADDLRVIRGRVEPLSAVKGVYTGTLDFRCEFDDFTADTPLNRLLKAAAREVVSSASLDAQLRRRARLIVDRMEEVSAVRTSDFWVGFDRRTGHYIDAVALARHVLLGRGRVLEHGEATAWTFLIPTPVMVEEGIRRILGDAIGSRWHVEKKGISAEGARITFNPDLVFDRGLATADVKYRLSDGEISRSELQQAITFAAAYKAHHCSIVSFWGPETRGSSPFLVGEIKVSAFGWIADPEIAPETAAEKLVRDIEDWLSSVRVRNWLVLHFRSAFAALPFEVSTG